MTEDTNNDTTKVQKEKKPETEQKPEETYTSEVVADKAEEDKTAENKKEKETEQETITKDTEEKEPKTESTKTLPEINPGMTVRVHQKIKDVNKKGEEKERIQVFEGIVLAKTHGNEQGATITIRKDSGGIGVEKIIPIHSPMIADIEIIKQSRVRQAKLFFLRKNKKKLKDKALRV